MQAPTPTNEALINHTIDFVKTELADAEGGHDWWHIERVWKNSQLIAKQEQVDLLVVELGALLHDIADSKFHNGDEEIGPAKSTAFLKSLHLGAARILHVENIVRHISFKGGNFQQSFTSPELAVVQDADRLDAIGAIGIARAFNYGGYKNMALHDPTISLDMNMDKSTYKKSKAPTINHFYEKLLRLKDRMNTPTGKKIAEERHAFMLLFLDQFYKEWGDDRGK